MATESLDAPENWDLLWANLELLRGKLRSYRSTHITNAELREFVKACVQLYFRGVRNEVSNFDTDGKHIDLLDGLLQSLLSLANTKSRRESYLRKLKTLISLRADLEVKRDIAIGEMANGKQGPLSFASQLDQKIIVTLQKLVPSSAPSYQQTIFDLSDNRRVSFRGTASELREVLREVLDHLAPDEEVVNQSNFKLEENQTHPTMRQKVRFILSSRGINKTAINVPISSVDLIEEMMGKLVRSTYNRGSASTHKQTERGEVVQIKMYIDSILCELLEIHRNAL